MQGNFSNRRQIRGREYAYHRHPADRLPVLPLLRIERRGGPVRLRSGRMGGHAGSAPEAEKEKAQAGIIAWEEPFVTIIIAGLSAVKSAAISL